MSEFPECLRRRGGPEDYGSGQLDEPQMNGQRCHRIVGHYGDCIFDRPAEFEPERTEARPLPKSQRSYYLPPVWPPAERYPRDWSRPSGGMMRCSETHLRFRVTATGSHEIDQVSACAREAGHEGDHRARDGYTWSGE